MKLNLCGSLRKDTTSELNAKLIDFSVYLSDQTCVSLAARTFDVIVDVPCQLEIAHYPMGTLTWLRISVRY